MTIKLFYEDERFELEDTERNQDFVDVFKDRGNELNGRRFTVDVFSVLTPGEWVSEFTFQVTPATRIALEGHSLTKPPSTFSSLIDQS